MLNSQEIMQLFQNLIWLLAGVGIFIVGMNFMSESLEKSAGSGMKRLLERISNNRFSGVGIGAGVTAIIQSSSATSVMVIGLVNAGVMTLMQATPIIMGANIGNRRKPLQRSGTYFCWSQYHEQRTGIRKSSYGNPFHRNIQNNRFSASSYFGRGCFYCTFAEFFCSNRCGYHNGRDKCTPFKSCPFHYFRCKHRYLYNSTSCSNWCKLQL